MKVLVIILSCGLMFASCKSSRESTDGKTTRTDSRKKMACAEIHVDMNTPHLDWVVESNSTFNKSLAKMSNVIVLPKDYSVYSIDSTQLITFFNAVNKGEKLQTVIPMPKPVGCQTFTVHNNVPEGTHVPGGMLAATGEAMSQKMVASYYKGNITAHINWFDIMFEVMTINTPDGDYVVVYAKQPPPENKNLDRNPANYTPQMQEIRYDK